MKEEHYGLPFPEQIIPGIEMSALRAQRAINKQMSKQMSIIPMNPYRRFQSRTAWEANVVRLAEYSERLELALKVEKRRREMEDEHSMRLGIRVLELEAEVRHLEDRLAWAQRKLGHKV